MRVWTRFPKITYFFNALSEIAKKLEKTVQKCEEKRIFSKIGIFGKAPRLLGFYPGNTLKVSGKASSETINFSPSFKAKYR